MERLLDSPELAEMLKIPERTLDQWAYQGKGPAFIKTGRHRRYRERDIEAWLKANRRGGNELTKAIARTKSRR